MLLTNTQVLRLRKAFVNGSSANIKLTGLPLMKNVLKPLAKSVLIPLRLTAASATDAAIHKKIIESDTCPSDLANQTTSIFSNEEMNIMKIIKSLEESGLLIKGNSETIKNERKRTERRISCNVIKHLWC